MHHELLTKSSTVVLQLSGIVEDCRLFMQSACWMVVRSKSAPVQAIADEDLGKHGILGSQEWQ